MGVALEDTPETEAQMPPGLVTVRISRESGLLARAGNQDTLFETFRVTAIPDLEPESDTDVFSLDIEEEEQEPETLF
jgi:penicillin-binding protein 1A